MRKKLTYEFVKEQFEKEGYKLLSEEYVNAHQKLEYICPEGHRGNIRWNNWQQNQRCYYCGGSAKLSIGLIRLEFEKEGYKLLTTKYKNAKQKLGYVCSKGHNHSIIWNNWKTGYRCPYCAGHGKPKIEFIKSEFEKEGYILLTKEYKNCSQKLEYVCPKGHEHAISWDNWKAGKRCYYCAGNAKPTIEFIRSEFEKVGYTLLSTEYQNCDQKLEYVCSEGHQHSVSWDSWNHGTRCSYCASVKNSGKGHHNWKSYSEEDLKKLFNYRMNVRQLTNNNYRKYKSVINPFNLPRKRNKYHLDHIYSIIDGFNANVLPEVVAHPNNLQMLLKYDNLSKNNKSDISLEELYNRYSYWEAENVL